MDTLAKKAYPDALRRRQEIIRLVMEKKDDIPLSEIYQQTGGNLNDLKQLVQRGLVQIQEVSVLRDPLEHVQGCVVIVCRVADVQTADQMQGNRLPCFVWRRF